MDETSETTTPEPTRSPTDVVVDEWFNETTSNRGFSVEVYTYLCQRAEALKERLGALTQ